MNNLNKKVGIPMKMQRQEDDSYLSRSSLSSRERQLESPQVFPQIGMPFCRLSQPFSDIFDERFPRQRKSRPNSEDNCVSNFG